jgi:hypothetical protein
VLSGVLLAQRHPKEVAVTSAAIALLVLLAPDLRRRVAGAISWGYQMQRATMSALLNGVRRNWSVWGGPK